jgi:hypothetical protein
VTAQKVSSQQGSGLGHIFRSSISKEADWITAKKKFINHLDEALKFLKLKLQTTARVRKGIKGEKLFTITIRYDYNNDRVWKVIQAIGSN